jgi:putative transposase
MVKKKVTTMVIEERQNLVNKEDTLSVIRQCELLSVNRGFLYYTPSEESEKNLEIMRILDEQYMETPYYGVERLLVLLVLKGLKVNHKRLRRLMRLVRWQTLYPQRKTTVIDPKSYKYPYLLRGLEIDHPNQVWAIDITYIPVKHGFMYLFAIIDIYSRCIVGWSLSNTMTAEWCCNCLKEAIARHVKPEIINSDQGSQFTSDVYVNLLKDNDIKISMDGRGRWADNIYIERFWRTIKYEYIYLNPALDGTELWRGVGKFIGKYNEERPHSSLGYQPPKTVYEGKIAA